MTSPAMLLKDTRLRGAETSGLLALRARIESAGVDDSDLLREAWVRLIGDLPLELDALIREHGFLDFALELAQAAFGKDALFGWRLVYTSKGGPYRAAVYLRATDGRGYHAIPGDCEFSAAGALVAACVNAALLLRQGTTALPGFTAGNTILEASR